MPKKLLPILGVSLAILVVAAIAILPRLDKLGFGASHGTAAIGGPFTLVDQDGRTVTDKDFRGKWMLIYFGYTFCPDVCPTSLAAMAAALPQLGAAGDKVQPVFITVDPDRDTPKLLKDYVAAFHPRLIGLTGSPEQVQAAARAYKVYAKKAPVQGGEGYTMDHSSVVYLMDPEGKFATHFAHGTLPADMAKGIIAKVGG